jgi:hypothetical protein
VRGTRAEDGITWTFNLTPLLRENVLDIVLTPGEGSNFNLTFDPPSTATLKTTAKPPASSALSLDFNDAPNEVVDPAVVDVGPALDVPAFSPAPAPEVALTTPRQVAPALAVPPKARTASGLALVLLLGAGLAAYILGQAPTPAIRTLGAMTAPVAAVARRRDAHAGEPQVGGLGRFARVRHSPPPKL